MASLEEITKLKKKLEEHEQRISALEERLRIIPKKSFKKISIKEFIISKKPKDNVQLTLVICYYLENYERQSTFNVKDIEDGFRRAKQQVPKNINYKIIRNIEKGHIMESNEKKNNLKAWVLTVSGEKFVENNFQ